MSTPLKPLPRLLTGRPDLKEIADPIPNLPEFPCASGREIDDSKPTVNIETTDDENEFRELWLEGIWKNGEGEFM